MRGAHRNGEVRSAIAWDTVPRLVRCTLDGEPQACPPFVARPDAVVAVAGATRRTLIIRLAARGHKAAKAVSLPTTLARHLPAS
jgi:hypothetical protein